MNKFRTLPTRVVKLNTYSSHVLSRAWLSQDKEPNFPFGYYIDPHVVNIHSYGYKRYIKDPETPPGLQGTESIDYEVSRKRKTVSDLIDYIDYLPCTHTRTRITPRESYYWAGYYYWRWYNKELQDGSSFTRLIWYPGLYGGDSKTEARYVVGPDRFREAAGSSLLNLLAGKPQRPMNVALAVIELKDLGTTVKQLCHFTRWCVKAIRSKSVVKGSSGFVRLMNSIRAQGLKANMRHLAEAYLWEAFGVQPTAQDILNFIKDVGSGKLHVKGAKPRDRLVPGHTHKSYFRARNYSFDSNGRPQFADYSKDWSYKRDQVRAWRVNTAETLSVNRKIITEEYRGCVFARLIPEKFEQYRGYFPTEFNWGSPLLSTAWELIPFSFVVDWFINVGKAIQRLDDLTYVSWTRFAWDEPWISYAKIQTEWCPEVVYRSDVTYGDLKPPSGNGWRDAEYSIDVTKRLSHYGWYVAKRTTSYERRPAAEVGVSYGSLLKGLIPRMARFKRYKLTTGMALVASMSKLFR